MTMTKTKKFTLTGAVSLLALSLVAGGAAAEDIRFDIEAQPLAKALLAFNEQSGRTVAAPRELVANKNAPAVRGEMEPEAALQMLLSGAGLKVTELPTGAYTVTLASADDMESGPRPFRAAQIAQEDAVREIGGPNNGDEQEYDTIVVTGTNIRGLAAESSPVRSFSREDILDTGAATAQEFIQTRPQNFDGGSNPGISFQIPGDANTAFNNTEGASVNLRGLGSGSTLVLLNGRRLAPTSGIGDFVDISLIPVSALERIEILTDGASSIYGADAVAGVTNFIIRDDFEGAELSARYGTDDDGDLTEKRFSGVLGTTWDSGNILGVAEFFTQDNLSADERSFSSGATMPNDILPEQERYSFLVTGNQQLAPDLKFSGDVLFSRREPVRNNNSIDGSLISRMTSETENLNVAAALDWGVSAEWFVNLSGNFSRTENDVFSRQEDLFFDEITDFESRISSDLLSADLRADGPLFALPAGNVLVAVGAHYREESFENFDIRLDFLEREADRDVFAFYGEAQIPVVSPEMAVPLVNRFEINVSGRYSDFSDFGDTFNPKVGALWSPFENLRLRATYSESFKPPVLGRVGAADRGVSVFPTSFLDAALGLEAPAALADVGHIILQGTAENLDPETSEAFTVGFDYDWSDDDNTFTVSASYFSIDFRDRLNTTPIPNNVSFFAAPYVFLEAPELFPEGSVILFPSQAEIQTLLDSLAPDSVLAPFGDDLLDASIINLTQEVRNIARTKVAGVDFEAVYRRDLGNGDLTLGLDGTYIGKFDRQAAVTAPSVSTLNTLFNPVDLNLRGQVGYATNALAANLFINHAPSYRENDEPGAGEIDAFTTVDATLRWRVGETFARASVLDRTTLTFSVRNLFDRDPPETVGAPGSGILGFDATNASPIGRFMAVELTKGF